MKVICIDDNWENVKEYEETSGQPSFGEILTVSESFNEHGGYWYVFKEYDKDDCFEQSGFAPLSNIDETELLKERQHETCTI